MTSFAILLSQQAEMQAKARELDKLIEEAKREEKKNVIAQIKSLMAEHGLTAEDLGTASTAGSSGKQRKPSAAAGRKVAPKYQHAQTGDTWTGRGITPKWLKAELDAGKKLESFLIAA